MTEFTTFTGLTFRIVSCYKCGLAFGIPKGLDETLHTDKQSFFCPNGHSQVYGTSLRDTVATLKRDLGEAIAARDAAEKSRAALLARVETGMCPHCRRHFENLKRHVATKHKRMPR